MSALHLPASAPSTLSLFGLEFASLQRHAQIDERIGTRGMYVLCVCAGGVGGGWVPPGTEQL